MIQKQRIGEIDLLRGGAILLMILFHTVVDLRDFFHFSLDYRSGGWYAAGRISAILFILLAGVSSQFSRSNLRRGLQVLAAGLLVSAATYWFNPVTYVRFGILHMLGCAMLLQPLAQKLPSAVQAIAALAVLLTGSLATKPVCNTSLLLPIGIIPPDFQSIDYYPLLPWYGIFLAGVIGGQLLYARRASRLPFPLPDNPFNWLGRRSLFIYLIHQPILLALLSIVFP